MSLLKKGAFLASARLIEKGCAFLIIIIASRHFGSAGIGEFFYYFSLVSLLIPIMDMGFEKLFMQYWPTPDKDSVKSYFGQLIHLKVFVGIVALIIAVASDLVIRQDEANFVATASAFLAIYLDEFAQLFRAPERAQQKVLLETLVPSLSRILTLILFLVLQADLSSGYQLCILYAVANFVGTLISLPALKESPPKLMNFASIKDYKKIIKIGFPFSITSLCVMISFYIDSVMLAWFSLSEVGLYNAAYRIIVVAAVLSGALCHNIFPKVVNMKEENNLEGIGALFSSTSRFFLFLFGSFTLGGIAISQDLIPKLYGDEFKDSALLFAMLCPLICLAALTNLSGQVLEAMGRQKYTMKVNIRSAIFNVCANLALIPVIGAKGAAISTIATESLTLISFLHVIYKDKIFKIDLSRIKISFILLPIVALLYYPLTMLSVYWALPIGGVILSIILFAFRKGLTAGLR